MNNQQIPIASPEKIAILESTPPGQDYNLDQKFYDERGNPVTDTKQIALMNAEMLSKASKPVSVEGLQPTKFVDAMQLFEGGYLDNGLLQVLKPNETLFLPDEEVTFGKMGDRFESREKFDEFYSSIFDYVDTLNEINKSTTFMGNRRNLLMYAGYEPYDRGNLNVSVGDSQMKYGSGLKGFPVLMSDQGIASMSGKFYTTDPISKERYQKDLTWWDKLTTNIVLNYDENNKPIWEETSYGRMNLYGQTMSIFGPQRPWANPWYSYPLKFTSAATTELLSAAYNITGLMNYGVQRMLGVSEEDLMKGADTATFWDQFYNIKPTSNWAAANWLEKFTYSPTERSRNTRWQELMNPFHSENDFGDFAFFLTEMIGMLMPQRALPWALTKAAQKTAAKAAPGIATSLKAGKSATLGKGTIHSQSVLGKTMAETDEIAKAFALRQTMPHNYVMRSMSMGIGTTQALSGFVKEGIEEGIPLDKLAAITIFAAPAVLATEFALSGWIVRGLGGTTDKEAARIGARNFWSKFVKDLPKKELGTRGSNIKIAKEIVKKGGEWGSFLLKGAMYEGTQEASEEVWYEVLRLGYNKLYENNPEAGSFTHYAGSEGFSDRIMANFVGGAWGGGLFDGMINIVQKKRIHDFTMGDVLRTGGKNAERTIKYVFDKKIGDGIEFDTKGNRHNGNPEASGIFLNTQGQLDAYGIPRNYEARTLHDLWVNDLAEKVELEKHWANVFDLNSIEVREMFMKELRLAEETMELVVEARKTHDDLTRSQNELKKATDDDTKEELNAKIASLQKNYNEQKERVDYNTKPADGLRYSKRFYDLLIDRAVIFQNGILAPKALQGLDMYKQSIKIMDDFAATYEAYVKKRDGEIEGLAKLINTSTELFNLAKTQGNIAEMTAQLDSIISGINESVDIDNTSFDSNTLANLTKASENLTNILTESKATIGEISVKEYIESPSYANSEEAIKQIESDTAKLDSTRKGKSKDEVAAIDEQIKSQRELIPLFQQVDMLEKFSERAPVEKSFIMYFADKVTEEVEKQASMEANKSNDNKEFSFYSLIQEVRSLNSMKSELNNDQIASGLENVMAIAEVKKRVVDSLLAAYMVDQEMNENISEINDKYKLTKDQVKEVESHITKLFDGFTEGKNTYDGLIELYAHTKKKTAERGEREKTRKKDLVILNIHILSELSVIDQFGTKVMRKEMGDYATEIKDKIHANKRVLTQKDIIEIEKALAKFASRIHAHLDTPQKKRIAIGVYTKALMEYVLKEYRHEPGVGYTYPYSTIGITTDEFLATDPFNFDETYEKGKIVQAADGSVDTFKRKSYISHYILSRMNAVNQMLMFDQSNLNKLIGDSYEHFSHTPSVEQETALKTIMSYILGDSEFFAYTSGISEPSKENSGHSKYKNTTPIVSRVAIKETDSSGKRKEIGFEQGFRMNGLTMPGIGGSGKTTVMPGLIFTMLDKHLGNTKRKAKVLVVAITKKMESEIKAQGNGKNNIEIATTNYAEFISQYTKLQDMYDLIIVDEASRLNNRNVEKIYGDQKPGTAKMLFMMDPLQAVNARPNAQSRYSSILLYTARTNQLEEGFRTGNYQIYQIQSATGKAITSNSVNEIIFPTIAKHNANKTKGLFYAKSSKEVLSLWYDQVSEGREAFLVVNSISEKYQLHPKVAQEYHRYIVYVNDYDKDSNIPTDAADTTIQGRTLHMVYVYNPIAINDNIDQHVNNVRNFRTASGRAKSFLAVINPSNNFTNAEVTDANLNEESEILSDEIVKDTMERVTQITPEEYTDSYSANKFGSNVEPKGASVIGTTPVATQNAGTIKKTPVAKKAGPKGKRTKQVAPVTKSVNEAALSFKTNESVVLKDKSTYKGAEADTIYSIKGFSKLNGKIHVAIESPDGNQLTIQYNIFKQHFEYSRNQTIQIDSESDYNSSDELEEGTRSIDIWAAKYSDTSWLPSSMAVMLGSNEQSTEDYFVKAMIAKNDILKKNNLGMKSTLDVVFYKKIELMTDTKNGSQVSATHYNVILLESNGQVVSTLYQPLADEAEYQAYDSGERISLKGRSQYSPTKWDKKKYPALYNYMDELRSLHQKGIDQSGNQNRVPLGSYKIRRITGGMAITKHGQANARAFYNDNGTGLFQEVINKGGEWKMATDENILVEWMADIHGAKDSKGQAIYNYYAFARLTPAGEYVPIELKGVKYQSTKDQDGKSLTINDFKKSVGSLIDNISNAEDSEVNVILNQSVIKHALNFNRKLITSNGALKKNIKADNHGYDVIGSKDGKYDANTLIENIKEIEAWIIANGYVNMPKVAMHSDSSKTRIDINALKANDAIQHLVTPVQEIRLPNIYGTIKLNPKSSAIDPISNIEIPGQMLKSFGLHSTPSKVMGGFKYGYKVFGEAFMNGHLEFQPNLSLHGKEVYGYVHDFFMVLEANPGATDIELFKIQHEAVHWVLKHLVSPETRTRILNSVIDQVYNERSYELTEAQAEEYLAEVNRGALQLKEDYTGITGTIKQFLNWLSETIFNVKLFGSDAHKMLYQLNNGHFRDAQPIYNNYLSPAAMHKVEETTDMTDLEDLKTEMEIVGGDARARLIKVFGSEKRISQSIHNIQKTGHRYSRYNGIVDDNYMGTPAEGALVWRQEIIKLMGEASSKNFRNVTVDFKWFEVASYSAFLAMDHENDTEAFNSYYLTKLLQEDVLTDLITLAFPEVVIDSDAIANNNSSRRFMDLGMSTTADHATQFVKSYLRTIRLREFKNTQGNLELQEISTGNSDVPVHIDADKFLRLMSQVNNLVRTEFTDSNIPKHDLLFLAIYVKALEYSQDNDSETANTLMSFYYHIKGDQVASVIQDEKIYSGTNEMIRPLRAFTDSPLELVTGNNDSDKKAHLLRNPNILGKIQAHEDLYNAVVSLMSSVYLVETSILEKQEGRTGAIYKDKVSNNNNMSNAKTEMKQQMISKLNPDKAYKTELYSRLTSNPKRTRDKPKAAYLSASDGEYTIMYDQSNEPIFIMKEGKFVFNESYWLINEEKKGQIKKIFKYMLEDFGIYVNDPVVNAIMRNKGGFDISQLAQFISDAYITYMAGVHSWIGHNVSNDTKDEQDAWTDEFKALKESAEIYSHLVTKRHKELSIKYGRLADNIDEDSGKTEPGGEMHVYDIFDPIDSIIKAKVDVEYMITKGWNYSATGERYNPTLLSQPLLDRYRMGHEGPTESSAVLIKTIYNEFERLSREEKNKLPIFYDLVIANKMAVSLTMNTGMNNDYKSSKQTHLTPTDRAKAGLHLFLGSLGSNRQVQKFKVYPGNFGDASTVYYANVMFNPDHRDKQLFHMSYENGLLKNLSMNNSAINGLLDNVFHQEYLQSEGSMQRILNSGIFPFTDAEKKVISKDNKTRGEHKLARDIIDTAIKNGKGSLEFLQKIASSNLTENVDYIITPKGNIVPGNAVNTKFISWEFYYDWKNASNEDSRTALRRHFFNNRFKSMAKHLGSLKIGLPTHYSETFGNTYYTKNAETGVEKWHPIYEAYMYTHFFAAQHFGSFNVGSHAQFNKVDKFVKSSKVAVVQGQAPVIGTNFGINKMGRYVLLNDSEIHWPGLRTLFGSNPKGVVTDGQRYVNPIAWKQYATSFGGNLSILKMSDAGAKSVWGDVIRDTMQGVYIKSASININNDNYRHNRDKYNAQMMYYLAPVGTRILYNNNMMTLAEIYNELEANVENGNIDSVITELHKLIGIERMVNKSFAQEMIMGVLPRSTVKIPMKNQNMYTYDQFSQMVESGAAQDVVVTDIDQTNDYVQNNPIHTSDRVAKPSQLGKQMAVNDNNLARAAAHKDLDYAQAMAHYLHMKRKLERSGYESMLREAGKRMTKNKSHASFVDEVLRNPNISPLIPNIHNMISSSVYSQFGEGIAYRTTGTELLQRHDQGWYDRIILTKTRARAGVTIETDTITVSRAEYDQYIRNVDPKNVNGFYYGYVPQTNEDGSLKTVALRRTLLLDKDGNDIGVLADSDENLIKLYNNKERLKRNMMRMSKDSRQDVEMKKTEPLYREAIEAFNQARSEYISKVVNVVPHEVVMNFKHADAFGLTILGNPSLSHVFNMRFGAGGNSSVVNIREWIRNNLQGMKGKDAINALQAYIEPQLESLDTNSFISQLAQTSQTGLADLLSNGVIDAKKVAAYYYNLHKALQVVIARRPTADWSMVSAADISEISYETQGVIVTSGYHMLLDGSDNDGDHLVVMYRHINTTESNKPVIQYPRGRNMHSLIKATNEERDNARFDLYWDTFTDPKNIETFMDAVKHQEMIEIGNMYSEEKKENPAFYDVVTDENQYNAAHISERLVGFAATAINIDNMLKHLTKAQWETLLPGFTYRKGNTKTDSYGNKISISSKLGTFLQTILEDNKNLIVSELNFNMATAPLFIALAESNMSISETLEFLHDPDIKAITDIVYGSMSLDEQAQGLYEVTKKKINYYKNLVENTNDVLSERYRTHLANLKEKIEKYKAAIADSTTAPEIVREYILEQSHTPTLEEALKEVYYQELTREERSEIYNYDKARNILKTKLKSFETQLGFYQTEGEQLYIDNMQYKYEKLLDKLAMLEDYSIKADALIRLNLAVKLGKELPKSDYAYYSFVQNIQNYARVNNIAAFLDQEINQSDEQTAQAIDRMTRYYSKGSSNLNFFRSASQGKVNSFMAGTMQLLSRDLLTTLEKKHPGKSIKWFTNGDSGISEGLISSSDLLAGRSRMEVIMQGGKGWNDYGYVTASGNKVYKEQAEARINELTRNKGIKVTLSGEQAYHKNMEAIISNEAVKIVVVFEAFSSYETNLAKAYAIKHGKEFLVIDQVSFELVQGSNEEALLNRASKQVKETINTMLNKKVLRASQGEEFEFGVAVFGTNLYGMHKADNMSDHQLQVDKEKAIDETMNLGEILRQDKTHKVNVMSALLVHETLVENILPLHPRTQTYLNSIAENQRRDVLTKAEYVEAQKMMNNAVNYEVIKRIMKGRDAIDISHKYTGTDDVSAASNISFQGWNVMEINYYLLEFPHYIMALKETTMSDNPFFKHLSISNQNLVMDNSGQLTPDEVNNLILHFDKLPPDVQFSFMIYDLLRYGFNNNHLRQFMGAKMLELISEHYTAIIDEASDLESSFWENADKNFVTNALVQSSVLGKRLSKELKKEHVNVLVENQTETVRDKLSNKIRFTREVKMLTEKKYDKDGNYDAVATETVKVNPIVGQRASILPLVRSFTELEVIQITDIAQARMLINKGYGSKSFTHAHNYEVGKAAIVMGARGRVTNKTTSAIEIRATKNANESRPLNYTTQGFNMNTEKVLKFIGMLQDRLPWLNITTVDNTTTHRPGKMGYVTNGQVYYNVDLIGPDTLLHEIIHPFIVMASESDIEAVNNFYNSLMGKVHGEIEANTEIVQAIREAYPDLIGDDFAYEVASTILGLASVDVVGQYINYQPETYYQHIKEFVSNMWNQIKNFFTELFFGVKGISRQLSIGKIGPESTLKELAEAMYKDIYTGKLNHIFNSLDKGMINPITINANQIPITRIDKYSDMQAAILFNGENYTVEEIQLTNSINSIYLAMHDNEEKTMYGQSIKEEWLSGDEAIIKKAIHDKIIKSKKHYVNEFKASLFEWLNIDVDAQPNSPGTINKYFKSYIIKQYGESMFWKTYNLLNIGPDTKVYSYSWLIKNEDSVLRSMYNKAYDDGNMYVVINGKYKNDSGDYVYDMSMVNINIDGTQYANQSWENNFISRPWVKDADASRLGINMKNNYNNVRSINMMMALMHIADNVDMANINLMTLGSIYMDNRSKQPHFVPINIHNVLANIDGMSKVEGFAKMLGEETANLFASKELKDPKRYAPDYMAALQHYWESQANFESVEIEKGEDFGKMYSKVHRERIQTAFKAYITDRGSKRTLLNLVNKHLEYIIRRERQDAGMEVDMVEFKAYNTEYRLLVRVASEIEGLIKVENDRGQNWLNKMTAPTYDASSNILQNVFTLATSKMTEVSGLYLKFLETLDKHIDTVNKKYREENSIFKSYFVDDSPQRFAPLLINTVYENGQIIQKGYKDIEIHWNKSDPRTLAALQNKQIDENMLEVGKWFVEQSEIFLKQILRQHYVHKAEGFGFINKDLSIDYAAIDKRVEISFKERWQKGMMPIMRMQASEAFAQGRIKEAYHRIMYQSNNPNAVFEEVAKLGNEADTSDGVSSMFYNQMTDEADRGIATSRRDVIMGIGIGQDGRKVLINQEQNDGVTQNIALVMRYLAMDAIAKPIIENEVMPLIDKWRTLATSMEIMEGKNMKNVVDSIDLFSERTLKGKHRPLSSKYVNDKFLNKFEGYSRLGIRLSTFAGVALSVPVAVLSISANATEAITESIANSLYPGAHDIFTMGSLRKAVAEWTVNREKVNNINDKYQVYESERWDVLNHIKYQKEQDHIYAASKVHFMNRVTDIEARKIIAIAVMIYDGSFYAHDEQGNYDVKKDRRYWNPDGTQTEEQKELQNWLVDDLRDDHRYEEIQKDSDIPVVAYSSVEIEKLQFAGTEFIIGVYDKQHVPGGDNYLLYDVVMQFKKFITAKFWNRYGELTATTGHQIRKVELANGEVVRDKHGHAMRYWKQMHKEGTYRTAARTLKNMLAHIPGVSDILDSYHLINKNRSLQEWADMTDLEKRNLWRAAMDVIAFSAAYMLFTGLRGLAPESEDPKKYAYLRARQLRLIDSINRGMLTSIAATPYQLFDMMTQIPLVSQARRMFNIVMLDEPWRNTQMMLPGRSTVVSMKEIVDFALED